VTFIVVLSALALRGLIRTPQRLLQKNDLTIVD